MLLSWLLPEVYDQVHGRANVLQTLIKYGLVDQYSQMIFPVVLGHGKRLFADGTIPASLRLVSSKTSTTGVIMATLEDLLLGHLEW